jgi:ribonuclease VapC
MNAQAVIDTSIFLAILLGEPDAELCSQAIRLDQKRLIAAAPYLECAIVSSKKTTGRADLDNRLLRETICVVPVAHTLARIAADAFARYGKGRHPAGLNLGDCFAYALARSLTAPLLFKGEDFARADVMRAA